MIKTKWRKHVCRIVVVSNISHEVKRFVIEYLLLSINSRVSFGIWSMYERDLTPQTEDRSMIKQS